LQGLLQLLILLLEFSNQFVHRVFIDHCFVFDFLCTICIPIVEYVEISKTLGKIWKSIEWKLYEPLLEIEWILIIHNNCIFPYYGYSIETVFLFIYFILQSLSHDRFNPQSYLLLYG
jgi:hypothetical protein